MSRRPVILITGANGEMGHGLIHALQREGSYDILALDIRELHEDLVPLCQSRIIGDVLDPLLLQRLVSEFEIHAIFHLAALLSTRSEFTPETAHEVNVRGTLNLLKLAVDQSEWHGQAVKFLFPSSIAIYGLPDLATKHRFPPLLEHQWTMPITMYGCNKLYCEHLGRYYARHYRQLAASESHRVDFRCIRFPGLISAFTVPHGGTSDYGPEMLHAAAQGQPYACFVREDTVIPFMAMPDAIRALIKLMNAPSSALTEPAYNIAAFSLSAAEFAQRVENAFPKAEISFVPDLKRQAIVDSWPAALDSKAAARDWQFHAELDLDRTFSEYLVPNIKKRYGG